MEDIQAVLEYLELHGFQVMKIVETRNKNLYVPDDSGFWRIFTYIEGKSYHQINDPQISYEAGKLLGSYHRSFSNLKYNFKHKRIINNNIPLLYQKYKDAVVNNNNPEIALMIPVIDKMIELDLPSHLRKTVNHGDPKISNFIFLNNLPYKAIAMVDFDDCGKNYNVLHELGDAFRSWSWNPEKSNEPFDVSLFTMALRGYYEGSKGFLFKEEWDLIPQAIKLNLLQLISRFIRDFFEDIYFEWDPTRYTSRKEHNLAQAKEYFALYEDICRKEKRIIDAMSEVRNSFKF